MKIRYLGKTLISILRNMKSSCKYETTRVRFRFISVHFYLNDIIFRPISLIRVCFLLVCLPYATISYKWLHLYIFFIFLYRTSYIIIKDRNRIFAFFVWIVRIDRVNFHKSQFSFVNLLSQISRMIFELKIFNGP